jgi:hypothetical protein
MSNEDSCGIKAAKAAVSQIDLACKGCFITKSFLFGVML